MTSGRSTSPAFNPETSGRVRNGHARCNSRATTNLRAGSPFEGSAVVIAVALLATLSQTAHAANYTASTETELRNAITAANADPDPSATITLTGNIGLSSTVAPLPTATKPMTLDTAGFTLSGFDRTSGSGNGGGIQAATNWTIFGALRGGNANGTGTGGQGFNGGFATQLINHGTITGGTGAGAGGGGFGAVMSGAGSNHVNNGTITGGTGGTSASTAAGGTGGVGGSLIGGILTNNGTINGGAGGGSSASTAGGGGSACV